MRFQENVSPIFSQAWKRFSAHAAERTAEVKKRGCVNNCKKVWKQASQVERELEESLGSGKMGQPFSEFTPLEIT